MSGQADRWSRRGFLASLAALGAAHLTDSARGLGLAAERKIKLGFDNFSIRAFDWKAPRLIEYASSVDVDTLLLSDLDVYESLDEDYLRGIRDRADRAGIELQAGTGSICPTSNSYNKEKWGKAEDHARLLIRTAKRLGTPVARCYLGNRRDRDSDGGIYRHIEAMLKVLKTVQSEAEDANVKIAIENHAGDMQAWELVELIKAAGKHFVGATMDPGNAAWTIEDPLVNLETPRPLRRDDRNSGLGTLGNGRWRHVHVGQHGTGSCRLANLCEAVRAALPQRSIRSGDHLLPVVQRGSISQARVLDTVPQGPRSRIRSVRRLGETRQEVRTPREAPNRGCITRVGTSATEIRSGREPQVLQASSGARAQEVILQQ